MKFLVDAQLPRSLRPWLIERGHEAAHVAHVLGGRTPDLDIAARALRDDLIILTRDADFAPGAMPILCRVVWLRCGNLGKLSLKTWLDARWRGIISALEDGARFVEVR